MRDAARTRVFQKHASDEETEREVVEPSRRDNSGVEREEPRQIGERTETTGSLQLKSGKQDEKRTDIGVIDEEQ